MVATCRQLERVRPPYLGQCELPLSELLPELDVYPTDEELTRMLLANDSTGSDRSPSEIQIYLLAEHYRNQALIAGFTGLVEHSSNTGFLNYTPQTLQDRMEAIRRTLYNLLIQMSCSEGPKIPKVAQIVMLHNQTPPRMLINEGHFDLLLTACAPVSPQDVYYTSEQYFMGHDNNVRTSISFALSADVIADHLRLAQHYNSRQEINHTFAQLIIAEIRSFQLDTSSMLLHQAIGDQNSKLFHYTFDSIQENIGRAMLITRFITELLDSPDQNIVRDVYQWNVDNDHVLSALSRLIRQILSLDLSMAYTFCRDNNYPSDFTFSVMQQETVFERFYQQVRSNSVLSSLLPAS